MLTLSALMAALCVVILSLGSIVETLDVSLAMLAGLVVMVCATEYGDKVGFLVFAVAGILSLLLPVKSAGICFLALGGWYPIVQKKLNMLKPFLSRFVKTLIFNVVLVLLLMLSAFVTGTTDGRLIYGALFLVGNICFMLYDILLERFSLWYLLKLRNRFKF